MSQPEAVTEHIDASFVPVVKPSVATVELDGELVVCDLDSWRLHKLDRVASLVWGCFDGSADIAELSADLADAFGTDVDRVREDVLQLVRSLADQDLLVLGSSVGDDVDDGDLLGSEVPGGPAYLVDPPGG